MHLLLLSVMQVLAAWGQVAPLGADVLLCIPRVLTFPWSLGTNLLSAICYHLRRKSRADIASAFNPE